MEDNIAGILIKDLKPLAIKYEGNDSFESLQKIAVKISVARAARLSYITFDGKIDYEKDIQLHDRLLKDNHCFDGLTEILTSTGWKKFTTITEEDLIAQIDVQNGNFCGFSKPIEIIKKEYKGKVYKYNAKNIDLFITEGHKLLGVPINIASDRIKSYESLEIFEANKQRVKAIPRANLKYKTYGEQEIKMFSAPKPKKINSSNIEYLKGCLAGFFIGDGHKSSTNKVIFRLKKERKINFLKHILTILKIQYKSSIRNNKVHEIKLTDNNMFSIFYNSNNKKTIPQINVENEEFIYGLFEGLKQSDGSIKRNTWVYDTSSKDLHDRILDLCPLVGLTGYSNPSYPLQKLSENQNTHYRISFTTNNHVLVNDSRTTNSRVQIEDYNGMVYCVKVPKHGIIVRRNGKTIITHNCSPFEHCARAMSNEEFDLFIKGKLNFRDEENYDLEEPLFKDKGWCNNFRGWINYRYIIENNYY